MAMARSLGNKVRHTKPWRSVETKSTQTIVEDMNDSAKARPLVMGEATSSAYLMVAIEAVVIGNVYDHHATENLRRYDGLVILYMYRLLLFNTLYFNYQIKYVRMEYTSYSKMELYS